MHLWVTTHVFPIISPRNPMLWPQNELHTRLWCEEQSIWSIWTFYQTVSSRGSPPFFMFSTNDYIIFTNSQATKILNSVLSPFYCILSFLNNYIISLFYIKLRKFICVTTKAKCSCSTPPSFNTNSINYSFQWWIIHNIYFPCNTDDLSKLIL